MNVKNNFSGSGGGAESLSLEANEGEMLCIPCLLG